MNKYVVCCDNAMVASRLSPYDYIIVSVLYQNEGGVGKSIPDAQEISRDLRDVPKAQPEANLAGRGVDFPITPGFWWSTANYSSSGSARDNPSL